MLLSELIETDYGKNINNVIYKITNNINGKCYIGQTKNSLRKRLLSHISHAKVNTKSKKHYFQYALLKYGISNFEVDVLETCETEQLNNKEIYWISKYNSHDSKFGYNCTFGGDGCSTSKPISEVTKLKISNANKELWSTEEYKNKQHQSRKNSWKSRTYKIVQLDNSLNFIKFWNSKKEIINIFGVGNFGRLTKQNPKVYSHGYIWMTNEEYLKEQNSLPLLVQLDYNYNLVNTYYDYKSANREIYKLTGYFGQTQYYCNTSRNIKTGSKKGGYIWMLYKTYKEIESK